MRPCVHCAHTQTQPLMISTKWDHLSQAINFFFFFFFCAIRTQWKANEDIVKGIRRTPVCVQNEQAFPSDPQPPVHLSGQGSGVPQSQACAALLAELCVHNSRSCWARLVCHLQHRAAQFTTAPDLSGGRIARWAQISADGTGNATGSFVIPTFSRRCW